MNMQRLQKRGFSLIELLIVMAIIGILAGIVYASFSGAGGKGRDAKRQADLKTLQNAIVQYKTKYGQYPAQGCGSNANTFATQGECVDYVQGLVPEFLTKLPVDSRAESGEGFAYITNSVGSVYKAMVIGTVESEIVIYEHPLSSCDMSTITNPEDSSQSNVMCGEVRFSSNGTPTQCQENNSRFQTSYGVWGGYAEKTNNNTSFNVNGSMLDLTQRVICR